MLSPLKTEKIFLEKIDVRLAPAFEEKEESADYKMGVKISVKKRPDVWAFRIGLALTMTPNDDASCRYERIAVSTVGVFSLPDDAPEDFVKQIVPLNCLAILHGFARGIVAQVTGLNDGGAFLLPTVNFHEAIMSKSKKSKTAVRKA